MGTVFSGATNLYKFADGGDDASAWSVASGAMSPAKGYMITGTAGLTRTFTGTIHSTDQTYNPTSTGFCLVGNPFPSIFDLGAFFSDNAHLSGLAALWVDDGSAGAGYGNDDYALAVVNIPRISSDRSLLLKHVPLSRTRKDRNN